MKSKKQNAPVQDSMLGEFFHGEIKDIYRAEKHLVNHLPKMKKAAASTELQNAFAGSPGDYQKPCNKT